MKKLPILLLFLCASAHTWARQAPELAYIEAITASQVREPFSYFSMVYNLGVNSFSGAPNEMKLRHWRSRTSREQIYYNIPILPYLTFSVGAGLAQEAYTFKEPYVLRRDQQDRKCIVWPYKQAGLNMLITESRISPVKVLIDVEESNTSLSVNYIELLFPELRLSTNRHAPESGFWVSLGGIIGIRWGRTTQYINYKGDNERKQETLSESFNLNDYRVGFTARIGWDRLGIFYTQTLTDLFHKGMGPSDKIRPWSIGASLSLL